MQHELLMPVHRHRALSRRRRRHRRRQARRARLRPHRDDVLDQHRRAVGDGAHHQHARSSSRTGPTSPASAIAARATPRSRSRRRRARGSPPRSASRASAAARSKITSASCRGASAWARSFCRKSMRRSCWPTCATSRRWRSSSGRSSSGLALGRFYEHIGGIIEGHHGRIVKFIGDGVLGVFIGGDHRLNALEAIAEMVATRQTFLDENVARKKLPVLDYAVGVGVGHGARRRARHRQAALLRRARPAGEPGLPRVRAGHAARGVEPHRRRRPGTA